MLRFSFAIASSLAALGLMTSPAFAAKEPLVLKPSSAWVSHHDTDGCELIRTFGNDDSKVFLKFSKFGPSEHFNLLIGGKPIKLATRKITEANVQFGPNEREQKLAFEYGYLGDKLPALIFTHGARIAPATASEKLQKAPQPIGATRLAAISQFDVRRPLKRPLTLKTGPLEKPLAALDGCVDTLVASWGLDVEKHRTLTRQVTPSESPENWIRSKDYPTKMLRAGQPALIQFRLNVDKEGNPSDCHIQETTRAKEFDDAVCKSILKRASFLPALDKDGQAMASFWRQQVHFKINLPCETAKKRC